MTKSRSYIAVPPGATIKEQLEDRNMSQKEFASRMDMSEKHISKLINGEVQLTADVAYRLEMVLGLSAHFWSKLEAIYRDKLAKAEAENSFDADIELMRKFPYNEMAKNGWVPVTRKPDERVVNMRKFFEVYTLGQLGKESLIPHIACRRLAITEKADFALIACAQKAKIEARAIQTAPINLDKLQNSLSAIREMTAKEPDEFKAELVSLLASCGIALVFLPHIGRSFLHGATFYDRKKIVICLTPRGKDSDKFWFSLFHEIGHIINGHLNSENEISQIDESEEDQVAKNTLIPADEFDQFVQTGQFSHDSVLAFAEELGIAPGIVVGRLQNERSIEFNCLNDLKKQYTFPV